ncbi:E3 ubiquitin-protein ligase SGR9, amyloplastic [Salvia miltiorrhiza]|uniref:E3 ubiquitin-protein ligase SGR9, amyloplastic n=1 Tax=Salvia miltiorrhiza TaxID=226208 RepID=UPI0025AC183C|nr:E3 ubiquitin-protein ligase SGR9, amyloplastic [Salvia miltiorrhiza]
MANYMNSTETIIMAALSTLSPPHLSHLSHSISALFRRHLRRLVTLLSYPTLFTLTLRHLQSLSLHQKSLLIARHLLSNLTLLNHAIRNPIAAAPPPTSMRLRDLDAVLLLLLLCELHQHDRDFLDAPPPRWRAMLAAYASDAVLRLSSFGGCSNGEALIQFVESARRCWNLVGVMGCGEGKEGRDEAASAAAVVALPSVAVSGGEECVICKEEMKEGRDVCELPCTHLFHWICILRWLKKRNTCPCCRHRLPTDDLRREIHRLLEELAVIGGGGGGGGVGFSQEWYL